MAKRDLRRRVESVLGRMLRLPNLAAVALGLVVFAVLASMWDTYAGAAAAAVVGAVATAASWLAWWRWGSGARVAHAFGMDPLGLVPAAEEGPAPALTAPASAAATAYERAVDKLQGETSGHVLLVASPSPGQGASTAALNLAIAATRRGRRVVLVDGDPSRRGLSRFGSSGPAPGLFDIAAGESLANAARIWTLDDRTHLPFIPAGDPTTLNGKTLASREMTDAVATLTEGSDLVLVDVPPIGWNGTVKPLAAHADGTVLVVTEQTSPETIDEVRSRLAEAGAPVVGFIVNRARETAAGLAWPWRRALKRVAGMFALTLVAFAAWNAFQIWDSWRGVERDQLDVAQAQVVLPLSRDVGVDEEQITEEVRAAVTAPAAPAGVFQSFLVVGSDEGGMRADVITLIIVPPTGSPAMVSIPRDLYLPNRCTQRYARINASLAGCGDINGPTLLALAVEDFTGIKVDHFALFDFDGFERIIDELGGIEICVEHAVRDEKSFLDLPAGCTSASGAQALAWVRSRRTEEYRDGRWRRMERVNDLTRNERQQDVILAMFAKMRRFDSVTDLTRAVRSLTDTFTLDDQLGIADAVSLAWSLRDIDPTKVTRIRIPVRDIETADGARVLVPTTSFGDLLEEVFPDALSALQ